MPLSVPKTNPLLQFAELQRSFRCLVKQLDDAIARADCLLVLSGMYAAHSGWIQSEIEAAKEFGIPIFSAHEKLPVSAHQN